MCSASSSSNTFPSIWARHKPHILTNHRPCFWSVHRPHILTNHRPCFWSVHRPRIGMPLSVNLELFAASLGTTSLLSDLLQFEAYCYWVPRTISRVLLSSHVLVPWMSPWCGRTEVKFSVAGASCSSCSRSHSFHKSLRCVLVTGG